ncbi:hypothetical protein, partial [Arthrobacter tecti]
GRIIAPEQLFKLTHQTPPRQIHPFGQFKSGPAWKTTTFDDLCHETLRSNFGWSWPHLPDQVSRPGLGDSENITRRAGTSQIGADRAINSRISSGFVTR